MCRILPRIQQILASLFVILQFFTIAVSQDVDVTVKITTGGGIRTDIKGKFATDYRPRKLWFMDDYAGISGLLTQRFSTVNIYDKHGYLVRRKRFTPADMINGADIGGFLYTVDLRAQASSFAAAHTSWISDDHGILMLDDLLPQLGAKTARVTLELPEGWKATSADYPNSMDQTETPENEQASFTVSDIPSSVIFIGRAGTRRVVRAGKSRLILSLHADWQFDADDGMSAAASIFNDYEAVFGSVSTGNFLIGLNRFPNPVAIDSWEADTRGRTVTIVSSDTPFKSQSLQRLHEQLRHELFHLWIPNRLNLRGNYDWFYEGFALYQSLKTGVAVNRLRFDDYLDTLSRAYKIDLTQTNRQSLIDASKNRWNGANTQIYARGMLVAFLCDLALLDASRGKRGVPTLLREIFLKHAGSSNVTDGNTAVITIMRNHPELISVVERYILGAEAIDWKALLISAGIETEINDQLIKLKVTAKPDRRQKDLLNKLGYNNWRNIAK